MKRSNVLQMLQQNLFPQTATAKVLRENLENDPVYAEKIRQLKAAKNPKPLPRPNTGNFAT